jgi:hypothetical protein
MVHKKKSPMRNVCCMCGLVLIMSLFFFGGLIPVIIGGLIILPCIYLASRASSKDKKVEQHILPNPPQSQPIMSNEPITSEPLLPAKFCSECGSPLDGDGTQCQFCGKVFNST